MIGWSDKEKEVLLKEDTSAKAIEKYYEAFPRSKRKKSSLYTYWWWRKQEEKKKDLAYEGIKKVARGAVNILTKIVVEKAKKEITEEFGKDTDKIVTIPSKKNVVHARIVETIFEPGDSVRYTRGSLILSPIGIVVDASKKKGIPEKSQKMKVRFGNYNMRDVYCCDYTIVMKGRKE